MAPVDINCCKFDYDGEYLAILHQAVDKHRLKIWDVNTNVIKVEFADDQISKFTCMNWGLLRVANKDQSTKKKRKSSANAETTIKVLALGTEDGSITIYSVSHGSILKTLRGGHNQRVNDVCFSPVDASVAYSCDDNGQLVEWDLNTARSKSQWNSGSGPVYCLTASDGLLYAAGCSLNVWDSASKKIVQNFTGHATAISQILPTVTAAVNGLPGKSSKLCLTIADQDRFVNIWSGEPNASETTALTLEANPRMIANMNGRVLAVTEEGMVAVWRQPFQAVTKKQKKSRTKRFELLLKIEEDQSPSTILPIAAAKFIQPEQIVVVYGSLVKPKIEIIHLEEQTAAVSDNTIVLKRQANNNIFIDNDQQRARQQLKASQKLYNENGAVIAAQNNFIPTRMALEIEEEQVLANGEASAGNDLTLQEKLDALTVSDEQAAGKNTTGGVNNSGKPQSSKKSNGAPRADSIQQMLVQALHSEDHQLLDECLEMGDLRLIFNTVHRLPTAFVVPFLKQVVRRFQSRPGRGIKLAKWIKAVLLIHMAYLMTVPGLTNELGPLYQTIDMRLAAFKKLLRLQGRLDVLDQHIRLRQEAAQQQQQLNDESALEAPMVVYDENEASWSEEEDDMEIEEGLAEDAAVVETDSEGWSSSDDDQYGDELDGEDDDDDEDEDPEEDD